MKKQHAATALLLGGLLALTLSAQEPAVTRQHASVVVGTFDSRAILMAYVRSEAYSKYLGAQKEDIGRALDRAREAGDDDLADAIDLLGPAIQKRVHEQGFGTAPVDSILARIEHRFPAIAQAAGVDVIVSKWNLTYRSSASQLVDITELLAAEFDPDEQTLKLIRQTVKSDPIPLRELRGHED